MDHVWMATGTVDVRPDGLLYEVVCFTCDQTKWIDKPPPNDGTAFVFADDKPCLGASLDPLIIVL